MRAVDVAVALAPAMWLVLLTMGSCFLGWLVDRQRYRAKQRQSME